MPFCNAPAPRTALLTQRADFVTLLEIGRGNRTQPFNLRICRRDPHAR